jgi:glycosyltransferase involved in cell wall biosynthesis
MSSENISKVPFVSIVVCTRNRKNMLRKCLNSISKLDYPKSNFEVLVVDNGSTDGTNDLANEFPGTRWVVEKTAGLSVARNTGSSEAKGSIVAFTDDDCIVDSGWLRNLVSAFLEAPSVIGVGGSCYLPDPEIIKKKLSNKKMSGPGIVDFGSKTKFVQELIGGNFAFKREAFNVAKFDKRLGRRGTISLGGEDSDFCYQLTVKGYKLLYTPDAWVYHMLPASRLRPLNLIKNCMQGAISYQIAILKWRCASSRVPRIKALRIILGRLLDDFFRFLRVRSFSTCCELITRSTALIICITFLDTVY